MRKRRSVISEREVSDRAFLYLSEKRNHERAAPGETFVVENVVWDKWGSGDWFVSYKKVIAGYGTVDHGAGVLMVNSENGETKECDDWLLYQRAFSRTKER